ncbi:MAG TPA: C4-dicarboxylate ABC transporter [Paenibacillaceae bacterium]|nr:C4-dicarboxylate ABC transporter [Paenibacillaceae bacterium]
MQTYNRLILTSFAVIIIAVFIGFGFTMNNPTYYDDEQTGLGKKVVIRFSHVVAENTPKGLAASRFAELVRLKTQGMVEVRIYSNAVLFNDNNEFQALQDGKVEMIAPSISNLSTFFPQLLIFDLPYAFDNEQMIKKGMDGKLGQLLFQSISNGNVKGLALWDNGFKQMTANQSLINPDDFKGLSFRVMASPVLHSQFQALGANAKTDSFNELYRQLENGTYDGEENTLSNIYSKRFYQVQKDLTIFNHGYLGYFVLMNRDTWNGLNKNNQQAIIEAMNETTEWVRQYAKRINQEALEDLMENKMIRIHFQTEGEKKLWKEAFRPVHSKFSNQIGNQVLQE